jgi:hypothetical protein
MIFGMLFFILFGILSYASFGNTISKDLLVTNFPIKCRDLICYEIESILSKSIQLEDSLYTYPSNEKITSPILSSASYNGRLLAFGK